MPRLVEQLQLEALDSNLPVSTLLRKVKLAAVKLRLETVADWVQQELSGYRTAVPDYRLIRGQPRAFNPYNGWIPIYGDPEIVNRLSESPIVQPLPEIENLVGRGDGELHIPYPPEIVASVNALSSISLGRMGLFFDRSVLVGIASHVRNAVLDWALGLEAAGIMGTEIGFTTAEQTKAAVSISIGSFSGNFNSGDVTGSAARLIQGGSDHSINDVVEGFSFQQLTEVIERSLGAGAERDALLAQVTELRSTKGTGEFIRAYQRFINLAADHMTILAPFIPGLTAMIGASG
jgi:hypothetical protein